MLRYWRWWSAHLNNNNNKTTTISSATTTTTKKITKSRTFLNIFKLHKRFRAIINRRRHYFAIKNSSNKLHGRKSRKIIKNLQKRKIFSLHEIFSRFLTITNKTASKPLIYKLINLSYNQNNEKHENKRKNRQNSRSIQAKTSVQYGVSQKMPFQISHFRADV